MHAWKSNYWSQYIGHDEHISIFFIGGSTIATCFINCAKLAFVMLSLEFEKKKWNFAIFFRKKLWINLPGQVVILNKYIHGKHFAHALCLFYVYNNLFGIVKVSIKLLPAQFSEKNMRYQ